MVRSGPYLFGTRTCWVRWYSWLQVLSIAGLGSGGSVAIDWIPAPSLEILRNTALLYAGSPWELYPIVTGNPWTLPLAHLILLIGFIAILISLVHWTDYFEGGIDTGTAVP